MGGLGVFKNFILAKGVKGVLLVVEIIIITSKRHIAITKYQMSWEGLGSTAINNEPPVLLQVFGGDRLRRFFVINELVLILVKTSTYQWCQLDM